jgi:hypothetical protein
VEQDLSERFQRGGFQAVQDFVQQEQAGSTDDGAGDDEAGALHAGERSATEEKGRFESLRELEDIVEQADGGEDLADFVEADVSPGEPDVVGNGGFDDVVMAD